MIEYIYFVKCPNCEDEPFTFFDEAKNFALGRMSEKPIITQIEVNRNDFGECTDSCDLGTVWSWEEVMKDTEGGYTDTEPAKSIFTKDDLKLMVDGQDPEFDNLDNSVDCEVEEPETSEVTVVERKPIPEGMTIEQLVEEMEENEDTVECTWCEELFDKSECRKEVDLGWLCSRCEAAIKSRGETLTFRENNYWDFLDEDVSLTEVSLSDIAAAANSELGTSYDDDYLLSVAGIDDEFRAVAGNYTDALRKTRKTRELSPEKVAEQEAKAAEHERQKNLRFAQRYVAKYGAERYNSQYPIRRQEWPYYDEATGEFVEGERRDELIKKFEAEQAAKRNAEYEERRKQPFWHIKYKYNNRYAHFIISEGTTKEEALALAIEYIKEIAAERLAKGRRFDWKESDVKVVAGRGPGGGELQHFEEDIELETLHDPNNEYDDNCLDETLEVSDSHLRLCPECGKETFDIETGICVDCGFN